MVGLQYVKVERSTSGSFDNILCSLCLFTPERLTRQSLRGVYCLLVVATLLDLLTPELVYKTDEFIASYVWIHSLISKLPV